jgi:hypothetical protein
MISHSLSVNSTGVGACRVALSGFDAAMPYTSLYSTNIEYIRHVSNASTAKWRSFHFSSETHAGRLLDELGDVFELWVFGGLEQLEQGHFGATDVGALGGETG